MPDSDNAAIGRRIQVARKLLGLTQSDVAARMDMVTSTVSAIEAGKRAVSGPELYELARFFRLPLSFFFESDGPVEEPAYQLLFRQASAHHLDVKPITKLQQLAADYTVIEEVTNTVPLPLPPDYSEYGFHTADDAETLADIERGRLGLGDAPVRDLQNLLDERVGMRTFLLPVEQQSWSGLVLRDHAGRPCITVNSREESYRRNYDLAHEYGHALVHVGRQDRPVAHIDRGEQSGVAHADERFADAFAGAFLMPRRGVLAFLDRVMRASAGKLTHEDLVHMAMHFGVSGQAASSRLVSLRKLSREVHESFWKRHSTFKSLARALGYLDSDDESVWKAEVILPRRFRYLALKAYRQDVISLAKLAELVRENQFDLFERFESGGDEQDEAAPIA